jgi:Co/Zn/Cd efflux system component
MTRGERSRFFDRETYDLYPPRSTLLSDPIPARKAAGRHWENAIRMEKQAVSSIRRITWIGVAGNVLIAALKFALGMIGHSQALVADAVHSASDLVTDFAILIGVKFWSPPPDDSHPYGHGRIEAMVTVSIGLAIAVVALRIGYIGFETILSGDHRPPALVAVAGAVASILGPKKDPRQKGPVRNQGNQSPINS